MTADIIKIIGEVGSIGVLVLVLYLVARYGAKFLDRLLDHLDAGVQAQHEVALNLKALCEEMVRCKEDLTEQGEGSAKVWDDLSRQLEASEKRAERRHRQQLKHADERHQELIGALQNLNGKAA